LPLAGNAYEPKLDGWRAGLHVPAGMLHSRTPTNITARIPDTARTPLLAQLPVALSGGFSITDHAMFANPHWDIPIIGRSVADAVDPANAAAHVVELAHRTERTA
jgi:3-keto-L-gulonate-6-phosphate decarboxylase